MVYGFRPLSESSLFAIRLYWLHPLFGEWWPAHSKRLGYNSADPSGTLVDIKAGKQEAVGRNAEQNDYRPNIRKPGPSVVESDHDALADP